MQHQTHSAAMRVTIAKDSLACRRVTNRESAKRIREKREEQMTVMSQQV